MSITTTTTLAGVAMLLEILLSAAKYLYDLFMVNINRIFQAIYDNGFEWVWMHPLSDKFRIWKFSITIWSYFETRKIFC